MIENHGLPDDGTDPMEGINPLVKSQLIELQQLFSSAIVTPFKEQFELKEDINVKNDDPFPFHGDCGGPMCSVHIYYEDGTEVKMTPKEMFKLIGRKPDGSLLPSEPFVQPD